MPLQLFGVGMAFNVTVNRKHSDAAAQIVTPPPPVSIPAQIGGMDLWLDAGVGVVSSANKVSVWQDQSGRGNNASQSTISVQPSKVNYGGMPAIAMTYNGLMSSLNFNLVRLPNTTVYSVVSFEWSNDWTAPVLRGFLGGEYAALFQFVNTNNYLHSLDYLGTGSSNMTFTPSLRGFGLLQAETGTNNSRITIKGADSSGNPVTHVKSFNPKGVTLGVSSIGGVGTQPAFIHEIIVFKGTLSVQQQSDMHTYFANKYNLGF